jgi:hypothetical protein
LDLSLAEPETVNGLLADNINHQTTSNEALKTQKKQYPLKGKASPESGTTPYWQYSK